MSTLKRNLEETVEYIRGVTDFIPQTALILGSGLGEIGDEIENPTVIEYKDIPYFPVSTVAGHKGRLIMGSLCGKNVVCMQGRFHFYEGYALERVVYPVRVMKLLGAKTLVVTNAAGGINTSFEPGDLMLICDHINLMGTNPLIGQNDDSIGERFPDMSRAYSEELRKKAHTAARKCGVELKEGVYAALTGPSYETQAEIRALRIIGADAVGMSTVPEVIAANHCGLDVLGISCITNMAAGIIKKPLIHSEVIEITNKANERFTALIKNILKEI